MARVEVIWYPWGGPPLILLLPIKPLHHSPDDHVISRVFWSIKAPHLSITWAPSTNLLTIMWYRLSFLVYKTQCLAQENSNCLLGHGGRSILSCQWWRTRRGCPVGRAFDRWEQLGGGSTRGPLFLVHMQPTGRWHNVVEPEQFIAQLRQLRDPVAGDNIGMALTEALHHAI